MRTLIALAVLIGVTGLGAAAVAVTARWSFSTDRRYRLVLRAHEKSVARHRANRRNR
jgi:hypothetical protein